nr:MAG TPA: hypothetical protein [Caudoviricetes sp.]
MVVRSPQCFASCLGYCPGEKCKYMKGITMNYPTVRGHGARSISTPIRYHKVQLSFHIMF